MLAQIFFFESLYIICPPENDLHPTSVEILASPLIHSCACGKHFFLEREKTVTDPKVFEFLFAV